MAAKLYTEDIDKTIDWGGDEKTNGLPVAGEKVQKFIKEQLAGKFGYMKHNKESNQYWVFADEADYNAYMEDPEGNAALRLTAFDAPAPATITISNVSNQVNTILLSEIKNQKLSFNYLVKDNASNIQPSRMSVVISINNSISGVKTVPTQTLELVPNATADGIAYEFDQLGDYLSEGTNTITVTITSLQYNVSTNVIFQYKVLNLMLTSTFADPGSDFYYYNGISLTDNEYFGTTLTASGTGAKYLRVFIDGENIYGDETASTYIGSNSPQSFDLNLQFKDANGEYKSWATAGKHSFQFYFFVLNEASEEIKSQTLYYDIVFTEPGMNRGSYVLFTRTLDQGELVAEGDVLSLASEQYESISVDYAIYDTSGRGNNEDGSAVIVELSLINKKDEGDEEVMSTQAAVPSSSTSTFTYTFATYGNMVLNIHNTVDGGETIGVNVAVAKSSVQIEATSTNMILELKAINRSNAEPEEKRLIWEYSFTPVGTTITTSYKAQFDRVLWNNQNGWIDDCLVLNNGATVTIPINIFGQWNSGLTFEIDFETSNVQDDDAVIMQYGSAGGAHIFINACNAELQSNNKVNIHTNYKENSRQKIQFIFNGNSFNSNDDALKVESPYLMYLVVNGILDRAAQFSNTDGLGANSPDSFVIGNMDGKATIKIHSIRIYRRALTLDECVNNYVADSKEIRKNYLFNDVYVEGSTTVDVNKILNTDIHIPVMTIFGDITNSIVKRFDKKANVPIDILYQDPENPEFNYFARNAWISNQGTSSMNYPRRNLRPYFNKQSDAKTLRGYAPNECYDFDTRVWYGLTDSTTITQIQTGEIADLDSPITVNGVTYTALTNKKTLKKKPANIKGNADLAIWFVHSGIKLYSDKSCEKAVQIKKLNKYLKDNPDGDIWVQGAYARHKAKDLYTDRWTLKCDYAESSMCHNAGVGRLWGDALRNVEIGSGGFTYDTEGNRITTSKPGMTNAQRAAQAYDDAHAATDGRIFGDIRTSCDGRPIVIVNRPRIKDENGQYTHRFGDPVFLGLYNIMTDKGSTPLFGFEDLKDEDGNTIYNAGNDVGVQRTECWECLQNGSQLAQMSDITTDDQDGSVASTNEDRPIWKTYEARWPDNDDLNDTVTNKLETVIRFVNFCQPAVSVRVGNPDNSKDGYTLSDFTEITEEQAAYYADHLEEVANNTLYMGVPSTDYKDFTSKFYKLDAGGNVQYDENEQIIFMDPEDPDDFDTILKAINKVGGLVYKQSYAAQNVTGKSFDLVFAAGTDNAGKVNAVISQLKSDQPQVFYPVEDDSSIDYVEQVYYPNSGYNWYIFDNTYDRSVVTKTIVTDTLKDDIYIGKVHTFDGKRRNAEGEQIYPDAWVNVYLTKSGNNYTYTNEMGEAGTRYASGEDIITEVCSGNVGTRGTSFKGKTLFEYFQDKKYEHFDIWKLAAYYVYLMRFAAVDQVIKNTMMTTEDGIHYYFINYDNDTVLGVRNDGYLAYDWQVTRETYDYSVGSYAYAGFGSSLWNLLEQDSDFMAKVQTVATAMVTSNVLTYDIALDMFNVKQAGTWSERLYNNSEMYKYIGTFNDLDNRGTSAYNPYNNTKYLPFLQGSRASHRDWWLRHRFDLYDSKWGAGEYATNALEFYMGLTASPSNPKKFLRIVPGSRFYFTIQSNNVTLGNNFVELTPEKEIVDGVEQDKSYYFTTTETLILGNPMKMLGCYKIKVLDFSDYRDSVGSSMNFNWDKSKGSMMTELIIGGPKTLAQQNGCALQVISNLDRLESLEVLDIRTCYNLSSTPDISNLGNLRKFLASDSNITNFLPAKGLNLEEVSLPSSIQNIVLDNCTIAQPTEEEIEAGITTKFDYSPNTALTHVEILDCKGIDIIDFLNTWYKDLKRYNVMMTNYSCVLSFDKIELPAEIDGVDSLTWLNTIRKEFGKNTSGEDNFKIKKGIIKLWGHAVDDNDEPTGGLTQDDYVEILKYWPEEYFRSDNAVHFDSNKSIFITVKSDSTRFEYDDVEECYNIVGGQTANINVTIFPSDNNRKINLIPYTWDATLRTWTNNWTLRDNYYTNRFGTIGSESRLINDNGFGRFVTAEYTNGAKLIRINVQDSLDTTSGNNNFIKIKILDTILPNRLKVYDETGKDISGSRQEITDLGKNYIYNIGFDTDTVNVDVKSIKATFGDSNLSETENGILDATLDPETQKMQVIYQPLLNKGETENTSFDINVKVIMDNKSNAEITQGNKINIKVVTNDIKEILLKQDGNDIAKDTETGRFIINNYIKETVQGNQKVYHYNIGFNPEDYNVKIKSMELDTNAVMSDYIEISNIVRDELNNSIESFDIIVKKLNAKKSIYETHSIYINLTTSDSNNHDISTINQEILWTIGCFYPDEIKLIKNEGNGDTAEYIDVELLQTEVKNIKYELHIYSNINGQLFYWNYDAEPADDIISNLNDGITHYLVKEQLPTSVDITALTAASTDDRIQYMIEGGNNGIILNVSKPACPSFVFTTKDPTTLPSDVVTNITIPFTVNYSITFNGKTNNFVQEVKIARSPAIAAQGNYYNIPISANMADNFYYLDRNLRIYTAANLGSIEALANGDNIEDVITAVLYLYEDDNANKKVLSIDPWLLKANKGYYWYKETSTFASDTIYGVNIANLDRNGINLLLALSGLLPEQWDLTSEGKKFEAMYNVYAFVTAYADGANRDNDGGVFSVINKSTGGTVTLDKSTGNMSDIITSISNKDYMISKSIEDDNMIFMIYEYYNNKYGMNTNGRILNGNEIAMLYNTPGLKDAFVEALNVFNDGQAVLTDWANLLYDESKFWISNAQERSEYNSTATVSMVDNWNSSLASGGIITGDYTSVKFSKVFWCNNPMSGTQRSSFNMPCTEVYFDRSSNDRQYHAALYNTSLKTPNATWKSYCLFTPII